jgi:hypothetical protein
MIESQTIISEINALIKEWEPTLASTGEDILKSERNKQNRTIRQILGHLIDSTSNNIHRVVHLQYQQSPFEFPNYATFGNNDRWIAIQNYQDEDWESMIGLWKYSLLHFCHVISNVDESKLDNEWISGPGQRTSLRSMIIDFPRHLKLHLSEIDELLQNTQKRNN